MILKDREEGDVFIYRAGLRRRHSTPMPWEPEFMWRHIYPFFPIQMINFIDLLSSSISNAACILF